jgi:hypothetical protein
MWSPFFIHRVGIFLAVVITVFIIWESHGVRLRRFYGKVARRLLRAGSLTTRGWLTISGKPNRLNFVRNFCSTYMVCKCGSGSLNTNWLFTGVGDPWRMEKLDWILLGLRFGNRFIFLSSLDKGYPVSIKSKLSDVSITVRFSIPFHNVPLRLFLSLVSECGQSITICLAAKCYIQTRN